jgi:hypothetical protein
MPIRSMTERITIYVSAGFATAPHFLDAFAFKLENRLDSAGWRPQVIIHYPYGDWSRKRRAQLHEIGNDIWLAARQKSSRYGGKNLFEIISQNSWHGDSLLLIGHSAGAVASIQAAEQLYHTGRSVVGVVQIGSPKCFIPASLKERVLYLNAANPAGKSIDPVTEIGTWGGWERARWGGWRWNSMKNAPAHLKTLSILGGHADYFRDHEPYVLNGSTNMQTTLNAIWFWLQNKTPLGNIPIEREDNHD